MQRELNDQIQCITKQCLSFSIIFNIAHYQMRFPNLFTFMLKTKNLIESYEPFLAKVKKKIPNMYLYKVVPYKFHH